jgi:broad specificity phosphatase PhoE
MIADVLARQPISALYASPALRCQQSLQPLSKRLELPVRVLAAFRESDGEFSPDPIENLRRGSYVAGRAYAALQDVVRAHGDGWAAVCSHGDLIPSLVAFLVGFHGLPPAASLTSRGEWYELRISGDGATVELRSAPLGFPVR